MAGAGDRGPSPFRSDAVHRIDRDELDPFGHRDYVEAMVAALEAVPPQFTLGLFGPWGSGKSTILDEVGRRLGFGSTQGTTAFALFDAWRYEGDSLRREFVREVGERLVEEGALSDEFDMGKHVEAFDVDVATPRDQAPRLNRHALFPALLAALTSLLVVLATYYLLPHLGSSRETVLKAELALLAPLAAFALVAVNRLVTPVQIQETRRRFEFPDQFAASFRALLAQVKAERLVIGIDNLDRCSPKNVAELLSTVKTFLEPASGIATGEGAKSLCFVIAADDEALRRHLMAEEMAKGGYASDSESGDHDQRAARESVDEYLRKFFNAGIRISEALDEDMRDFTVRELADFVAAHDEIDEGVATELVSITAQGLKRNPRRLKQFVNNLELRLQLFADRKAAGRIQIDPDVIVVAKLAILEEEFPEDFARLRADPRLLELWHEQVSLVERPDGLGDQLVAFLRFTDHIRPRHIRAYLTLKQTAHEIELPHYLEFVDLLDDGDVAGLTTLLAEVGEDRPGYVEAAGRHFRSQLQEHSWNRAHNTARGVTEVPALHGENGELVAEILDGSLSQPALRQRLGQLDPRPLLQSAAQSLPQAQVGGLIHLVASELERSQPGNRREALCSGLVLIASRLEEAEVARVARALRGNIQADFGAYAELAEALPDVVNRSSLAAALQQIETGTDPLDAGSPALRVAVAASRGEAGGSQVADRILAIAMRSLSDYCEDEREERFAALARAIEPAIRASEGSGLVFEIARDLRDKWLGDGRVGWGKLELAAVSCSVSEAADREAGEALGARVLDVEEPELIPRWVGERYEALAPHFRAGFRRRVAAALAGVSPAPGRAQPGEISKALPDEGRRLLLQEAVRMAAVATSPRRIASLLGPLDDNEVDGVVMAAAKEVLESGGDLGDSIGLVEFLVTYQEHLPAERRARLAKFLVDAVDQRPRLAQSLGPAVGGLAIDDPAERSELVHTLISIEREASDPDQRRALLGAAGRLAAGDSGRARALLDARLAELPDDLAAAADA